jgi:hypothetical protein
MMATTCFLLPLLTFGYCIVFFCGKIGVGGGEIGFIDFGEIGRHEFNELLILVILVLLLLLTLQFTIFAVLTDFDLEMEFSSLQC